MVDRATIGILYPGEMGSAIGKVLQGQGHRIVTTLAGRGKRTEQQCRDAGLEILDSFDEVVQTADVVLSLVPPSAAWAVAERYATCVPRRPSGRLYADLNSVAPSTSLEIGSLVVRAGVEFVDGAVHGLASQLPTRGRVYLSGPAAGYVASLFGPSMVTKVVGSAVGDASTLRMLISGLTKGVIALFLEMSLAARRAGILPELLACYEEMYPGVLEIVERILPTYPQHAGRRGEEMRELEHMLHLLGQEARAAESAGYIITEMGRLGLGESWPTKSSRDWTVTEVVESVYTGGLLTSRNGTNSESTDNRRPYE